MHFHIAESSNGRTSPFGGEYWGSNPCSAAKKMEFAVMLCMGSPRVVFPVPRVKGYVEPDRDYDFNMDSARFIVDKCVRSYWSESNYLHVNGKPYVSFFMPDFSNNESLRKQIEEFFYEFRSYANDKYRVEPYMVGVLKRIEHLDVYLSVGIDKFTGYQILADFDLTAPPLQDYMAMLELRKKEWKKVVEAGAVMIPSSVVGWDSSPRGEHNLSLDDVRMCYPYTPILVKNSPKNFKKMLEITDNFIMKYVPPSERYSIICAWNEVAEGNALIPKLIDNKLDYGYLEALKEHISSR